MKKTVSIVLALILGVSALLSLASCGEQKTAYTVGVCQLAQHPALDAATKGFCDALKAELGEENVKIDVQNASGEIPNCTTIVNGFVSSKVDLILANATAPLQAAAAATDTIPVLGTSISHFGTALEIDNWKGTTGRNVSGTSDLAPLDQQAQMVKEWFPDAKNVGLLYCSAEANSIYQVEVIEGYLKDLGLTPTRFAFTDTNDVASVAQAACDKSDVLYIPTDNVAANNAEAIANVLTEKKVPAITGEAGICAGCGVATLSIDYYELGQITGKMAAKILRGEEKVESMPVQFASTPTKQYNEAMCKKLGLTVPDGYAKIAD